MCNSTVDRLEALFVEGKTGRLFCIREQPAQPQAKIRNILIVPPFGEEMNTSRHFLTQIRRALCQQGYTVIQPDLYGTGDSEGLFEEATWNGWVGDLQCVFNLFCTSRRESATVVALRSGCLLAQDFIIAQNSLKDTLQVERLLYLCPEVSGFQVINTLIRMHVASQRISGAPSDTAASLWQRFERKETQRLSGYDIGSSLALQMREKHLAANLPLSAHDQEWINLGSGSEMAEATAEWREHTIASKRFWLSHDIEPDIQTIKEVVELIDGRVPHAT